VDTLSWGTANAAWSLNADVVVVDGALTEAWGTVAAAIREQFPAGDASFSAATLAVVCTLFTLVSS